MKCNIMNVLASFGYVFFKVWVTVDLIGGDPKALDTLDLLSFCVMPLQGKSQMY